MKIDADDLLITGLIVGGIIYAPFLAVYYGGKWIYSRTPWELKKKRELNEEIHLLEEKLGLYGRNNKALHYDPYYYKNKDWYREDYLNDLKKKVEKSYQSPDIIVATIQRIYRWSPENIAYEVILLVHKEYYDIPEHSMTVESFFTQTNSNVHKKGKPSRTKERYLTIKAETRAECGCYDDYFIARVPGKYKYNEIATSGNIKGVIKGFKKKYSKEKQDAGFSSWKSNINQSPDIILAIEETKGGIAYSIEYSGKCQVLMLANKNIYEIPPYRGTSAFFDSSNAETYFEGFYDFICRSSDLQGRLYTLTECGDMKNYFVVKIPGGFECREVGMENEKIKLFVENFKKNYKKEKEDANHSLC